MKFDIFQMERNQTLFENEVEINLTESGVHPWAIEDILPPSEMQDLLKLPLGYGWTDGRPDLRANIASWYPGAGPSNVLVTNGSSEATMIALMTLVEPGERIVFAVPNFMQVDGLGRALGFDVQRLELSGDNGWQIDPACLDAASSGAKVIAVTNPANPTGSVLTQESRDALVAAAGQSGAWLLVDEIYRGGEIDGPETQTLWGTYPRLVVTSSLSKSFACPGLRLGWIVAPVDVVAGAAERQDYTTIGSGILSQILAAAVMKPDTRSRLLSRGRDLLRTNANLVGDWMSRHPGWSWKRPEAGGMAFLRYPLNLPSEEFSRLLREEESVFVVAGSWFGIEQHIRIGIGVPTETLAEGLKRLDRFLVHHAG